MLRKSALQSGTGIASALPLRSRTPAGTLACSIMPALGSTPVTSAGSPTTVTAAQASSPVPVPTSTTVLPGVKPASRSARLRYQEPVPSPRMRGIFDRTAGDYDRKFRAPPRCDPIRSGRTYQVVDGGLAWREAVGYLRSE